ncbi:glycine cleavage H-protein-domain-containing protein [Epithele typhae]|uniref:glycine cleavage H-protein-domain-containing protein n=1 Tax=Epithele typhae TaxID=378194 RepID=UPI0020075ADF|nr:glycine cleavage H-protein-domain-containing protein [Epithele typhae]KAH9944077.1 glycine cleavage H-protein-domain-containing protein [Epithele typhae]
MFSAIRQASRSGSVALRAARMPATAARVVRPAPTLVRTLITKRYTKDHEMVAFDDATSIGTVSITDYAQSSLGDVVYVELPEAEGEITMGDQIGAVESVKAASDIYAPVSGTVTEVNKLLDDEPSLLNKSPEEKGWLCKVKLSEPSQLDELLTEEQYKAHCDSEAH